MPLHVAVAGATKRTMDPSAACVVIVPEEVVNCQKGLDVYVEGEHVDPRCGVPGNHFGGGSHRST
eukprot:jgi/Chlat1/8251/Chrsp77S07686